MQINSCKLHLHLVFLTCNPCSPDGPSLPLGPGLPPTPFSPDCPDSPSSPVTPYNRMYSVKYYIDCSIIYPHYS